MSDAGTTLLDEIEAFMRDTGLKASYVGKRAVGNSELVDRLRRAKIAGRRSRVSLDVADRCRAFMAMRRAELRGDAVDGHSIRVLHIDANAKNQTLQDG